MRTISLGPSGIEVGAIAYGCWRFAGSTVADAQAKIETALDAGMTLIDTADIYGLDTPDGFGAAEDLLGRVLQRSPELRDQMVLATKGGIIPPAPYNASYDYLTEAINASLRRLGVDQVDLYQIHRPDLLAPVPETARALNDIMAAGKARAIGVSNFTVSQCRALAAHLDVPLATSQPEFSVLHQDPMTDGTLDWCGETGASCLAWSPLAGGRAATGMMTPDADDQVSRVIAVLDHLAETHDVTRTQVALAFVLGQPSNVIPIVGTQKPERIKEAAAAAAIQLTRREWYDIVEAYRGAPMP
ncbi:MAG: aldo/keto reductase [Pseudomonadota bacterium]